MIPIIMEQLSNKRSSNIIKELREQRNKQEANRTRTSMLLAAKISSVLKEQGIGKSEFAVMLAKKASVISKWLSGSHNFTSDTLTDIGSVLNIDLFKLEKERGIVTTNLKPYLTTFIVQPVGNIFTSKKGKVNLTQVSSSNCKVVNLDCNSAYSLTASFNN